MKEKLLLIFVLFFGDAFKAQVDYGIPQSGLQGFWPFSGNANDISGNNRHGNAYGARLARDRFDNENSAYYFNGKTDFITTNYEGVLGPSAGIYIYPVMADGKIMDSKRMVIADKQ